jgi:hypothetical protein
MAVHEMVARSEHTLDEVAELGLRIDLGGGVFLEADEYVVRANGTRVAVDFKLGDAAKNGLICCAVYDDATGSIVDFNGQMGKAIQALIAPDLRVDEVVFPVSGNVSQTVLDAVAELNRQILIAAPVGRFSQSPVRVIVTLGGGF